MRFQDVNAWLNNRIQFRRADEVFSEIALAFTRNRVKFHDAALYGEVNSG